MAYSVTEAQVVMRSPAGLFCFRGTKRPKSRNQKTSCAVVVDCGRQLYYNMHMNEKGFTSIVLIVFVVVVAGVVGYVALFKKPVSPVATDQQPTNSQGTQTSTTPLPLPPSNEMATWSIYSNATYKYQFKYPPEFEKHTETAEKVFLRQKLNQRTTFNVFVNPEVGLEGYDIYKSPKSVVVDGVASQISFGKSSDGQLFINTSIDRGGNSYLIYAVAYGDQIETEKMFSDILSTFKFLK